jgi:adenylate cyclase
MSEERVKRKLSAILSADVVGYSRLMGEDEVSTVRTLEAYRKVMSDLIEQFRGRVVDSPGDNLLAEFSSVVDAVQCAVEIHDVIRAKNEELTEDRRMLFRIGVNLGDVIEEGDRIYGDGVNIAARLEGLAEAGGICISGSAHEQIENKLALGYEFLGEHTVKNIAKPVKVYKVPMGLKVATPTEEDKNKTKLKNWQWTALGAAGAIVVIIGALTIWNFYLRGPSIEPASVEPGKTSFVHDTKEAPNTIAVLPFDNLSPDPEQEYFSDGLADALITKLSQVKDLQVTARTSSFYFKGKKVDMRTIGETLGVAYLLEGSMQKSGNQIRIIAQLIKAADGYHLWSETYDRELKDIFTIQDNIVKEVTTALSVTLGVGEFSQPGMTHNIEAYDKYLRAISNGFKYTPDSILLSIDQFKQALDIDPDFGLAWLGLASNYSSAINLLPPRKTLGFRENAAEALKRAEIVVPDMPELLLVMAGEYPKSGNWLESEYIYMQILDEQGHANPTANEDYGVMLMRAGRNNDALIYLQRAKRLNPLSPSISFNLSVVLLNSNRIDEALAEASLGRKLLGPSTFFVITECLVALEINDRPQAATIITTYYKLDGDYPDATMLRLAEILLMEDKETALSELQELSKVPDISPISRVGIAHIASVLGDVELAFECLRESLRETGNTNSLAAIWHPIHNSIRQLPAFKAFVREIGLYDYWRESGKWTDLCRPLGDDDFVCN